MQNPTIHQLAGCTFRYWKDVFPPKQCALWFSDLMTETDWEQSEVRVYGKLHKIPRLNAWHGPNDMVYSGHRMLARPLSPLLIGIANQLLQITGEDYNSVLLNLYRNGQDAMGWHSDDEPEFDPFASIASFTLGGPRKFVVKERLKDGKLGDKLEWNLGGGDILVMDSPAQQKTKHSVTRTKRSVETRINLTFRRMV